MEMNITMKSGQVITTFPTKVEFSGWPRQVLKVYHGEKVDEYSLVDIVSYEIIDKSLGE